jgi:hypothetical protein
MQCKNEQCDNEDSDRFTGAIDADIYDGVLVWRCNDCGFAWARWESKVHGYRHDAGVRWAARINAETANARS